MTNNKHPSHSLLSAVIKTDFFKGFIIVVSWQTILFLFGYVLEQFIAKGKYPGLIGDTNNLSFFSHTARWDSGWIRDIARTGDWYRHNVPSAAFYPLFPLLAFIIQKLSFGTLSIVSAGFIVNVIASWLAFMAVFKIADFLLENKQIAWLTALAFMCFPTAFFLHAFYSEAVFCAFGFWSYLFALRRQWAFSTISLAFLTASRITAVLFVVLCGLEYLRSKNWSLKKLDLNIAWFIIAPLGFVLYGLYLLHVRHDFLGMLHAYRATSDWSYQVFNPNFLRPYIKSGLVSASLLIGRTPLNNGDFTNSLLPFLALTLLLITSLLAIFKIKGWAIPLGLFGIASFIMFTLNSNTVSEHRYVLPCLVVYLVGAEFLRRNTSKLLAYYITYFVLGVTLMAQVFLYSLFVAGFFVG